MNWSVFNWILKTGTSVSSLFSALLCPENLGCIGIPGFPASYTQFRETTGLSAWIPSPVHGLCTFSRWCVRAIINSIHFAFRLSRMTIPSIFWGPVSSEPLFHMFLLLDLLSRFLVVSGRGSVWSLLLYLGQTPQHNNFPVNLFYLLILYFNSKKVSTADYCQESQKGMLQLEHYYYLHWESGNI